MTGRLFDLPAPLAATRWPSNAELIATATELLDVDLDTATVADLTYGRGHWWNKVRPRNLVAHDLAIDGVDFRDTGHPDAAFDLVAFDPPYLPQGGTAHNGAAEYRDRYGLTAPSSDAELWTLIAAGLDEAARIVRPGGHVLAKCQPYTNGKQFRPIPARLVAHAEANLPLRVEDELIHLRDPGPSSTGRKFSRARRNYSVLTIFQRTYERPQP